MCTADFTFSRRKPSRSVNPPEIWSSVSLGNTPNAARAMILRHSTLHNVSKTDQTSIHLKVAASSVRPDLHNDLLDLQLGSVLSEPSFHCAISLNIYGGLLPG